MIVLVTYNNRDLLITLFILYLKCCVAVGFFIGKNIVFIYLMFTFVIGPRGFYGYLTTNMFR